MRYNYTLLLATLAIKFIMIAIMAIYKVTAGLCRDENSKRILCYFNCNLIDCDSFNISIEECL